MCGIFCYFCKDGNVVKKEIIDAALRIQHRGPDETHIIHGKLDGMGNNYHLIFHRLMINGLCPESGQPLIYPLTSPSTYLLCNGEIYNYRELRMEYTDSKYQYHSW